MFVSLAHQNSSAILQVNYPSLYLFVLVGVMGACRLSQKLGVRGKNNPGRDTNPSQGTYTFILTDSLATPIHLSMLLDCGQEGNRSTRSKSHDKGRTYKLYTYGTKLET